MIMLAILRNYSAIVNNSKFFKLKIFSFLHFSSMRNSQELLKLLHNDVNHRPDLDFEYLLASKNSEEIKSNIRCRKNIGNIDLLLKLWNQILYVKTNATMANYLFLTNLWKSFYDEAMKIPNKTSPETPLTEEPDVVYLHGNFSNLSTKNVIFAEAASAKKGYFRSDLGFSCGQKSYVLLCTLAQLEHALIQYAVQYLINNYGFTLISVDDVVDISIPLKCGLIDDKQNEITYKVTHSGKQFCLSGTAEMGISSRLQNWIVQEEALPLKLVAVSRCFRKETSEGHVIGDLYRLHEFSKVEMFVVDKSNVEVSQKTLLNLVEIQKSILSSLNITYRVCRMPAHELGSPAYAKYDLEAWMPGRQIYGELTSASNCTDYQSRRLNLKCRNCGGGVYFPHTLNGTALAVPRLIIALIEQSMAANNRNVSVPDCLSPWFNGKYLEHSLIMKSLNKLSASLSL